jgi:hypothetical protein
MADANRLELTIDVINTSGAVIAQFKSELTAVAQEAMKAAASVSRATDQMVVSTSNIIERASAAAYRSLERLEARAALAGKTGSDKLTTQFEQGKAKFGGDETAINRYRTALERLAEVEGQREKAAQARQEAVRTRANNDAIYKLQSDRVRDVESPTQRVQRERGEFFDRSGLTLSQRAAAYQEFAVRGAAARQQETEAAGKAAGKAVLSGQAEFEAGLRKLQENDAALAGIRANRVRATETPTQRVQRERADFLQRGLSPSQRVAAGDEFAIREAAARAEETRKAGIAAGKAVLPGAAPFEEAFKKVRARDAEILEIEDRARKASLSKPDYYRYEMESLLSRAGTTEAAAKRIRAGYADIIKAAEEEEKHGGGTHQVIRRGILAVKDAIEGSSRGAAIEVADIFIGTSGSGGILQSIGPKIAEVTGLGIVGTSAIAGFGAALIGLGIAGLESAKHLAATGEEIRNFSTRTGIAPERVQAFQFAATASGVGPDIAERLTKGLAQAADDQSPSGAAARKELKGIGVDLYDQFDQLKPTEQIIGELSDALNKLPEGLKRSAAGFEIFKRVGPDALPFLKEFRANMIKSDEIGNTFSAADIEMLQKWDESIKAMEEEFKRFKLSVEMPLAIYGTLFLKGIMVGGKLLTGGGAETRELGEKLGFAIQDVLGGEPEGPAPIKEDPNVPRRIKAALNQYNLVKRLEQSGKGNTAANKGLEDVIAARKQGLELDHQFAEIQLANKTNEMSARLETRKGFSTPEDIEERLRLATLVVDAKQKAEIEERRKVVDTKTGRELDMSNDPGFKRFQAEEEELRPKRIRNEFEKILGKAGVDDEQRLKAERDDWGKSWKEAFDRKQKVQMDLQEEAIRGEYANRSRELEIAATTNDRERDLALQQVGQVNAQTLQEKIALEDQKLAIEQMYAERSLAIQIAKLERERTKAIDDITGRANRENIPLTDPGVVAAMATENQKSDQEIAAAKQATADKEMGDFQKTQNDKTKLQIESAKTVYQNLKQQAGDLFDQMVFHTKSWGEFAKGIFKTAILTPIKDIFSSQVSAFFTRALTGQKVSFGEVGNGAGVVGKAGGILGRLGMGQPRFGEQTKPVSRLDEPGHLGDVLHVGGAVPVVIQNAAQVGQGHAAAASSGIGSVGSALATSFGSLILAGGRNAPRINTGVAAGIAESKFIPESLPDSYGMPDGLGSGPSMLADMFSKSLAGVGQFSPNGFPTMGEVSALGTPSGLFSGSDNPFAVPTAPPYADQGLSGDGLGSGPSILTQMFGNSLPSSVGGGSQTGGFMGTVKRLLGFGNPASVSGTPPFVDEEGKRGVFGTLGNLVFGHPQFKPYETLGGTPPFLPGGGWVQNTGTGFSGFLNRMLGGGWSHHGILSGMNPDGSMNATGGSSGGGIFGGIGKLGGSLFGGIGKLFGFGGSKGTGEIDPETGAPLGHGIPGSPDNSSGEVLGRLHGGTAGGILAAAGLPLALDGIRRGGVLGTFEAAGGGAAIGFRFGGPIGAAVGAAIGGGIALAKTFGLFGDDRKHIKKLVKEIYGMDINNAMADQIVAIAKQSFGGQHDVAVRSPQVRELLRLYAQTTGQKSAEDKFVADTVHGASLVEAGGKLQQQAVYDNGSGYAYASPFGTYQGVQTSPLPTYGSTSGGGPTHVQLVLNGQAAADVLAGQVSRVATPSFVQGQSQAALGSSIGRNSQTAMTLAPASISR